MGKVTGKSAVTLKKPTNVPKITDYCLGGMDDVRGVCPNTLTDSISAI